jgi:hypothetical protein
MSSLELRNARPHEPQEVADTDARLLSQILIGTIGVLMIVPFVTWALQ